MAKPVWKHRSRKSKLFFKKSSSNSTCRCWHSVRWLASVNVFCTLHISERILHCEVLNETIWTLIRFALSSGRKLIHKTQRETATHKRNSRIFWWHFGKIIFLFDLQDSWAWKSYFSYSLLYSQLIRNWSEWQIACIILAAIFTRHDFFNVRTGAYCI